MDFFSLYRRVRHHISHIWEFKNFDWSHFSGTELGSRFFDFSNRLTRKRPGPEGQRDESEGPDTEPSPDGSPPQKKRALSGDVNQPSGQEGSSESSDELELGSPAVNETPSQLLVPPLSTVVILDESCASRAPDETSAELELVSSVPVPVPAGQASYGAWRRSWKRYRGPYLLITGNSSVTGNSRAAWCRVDGSHIKGASHVRGSELFDSTVSGAAYVSESMVRASAISGAAKVTDSQIVGGSSVSGAADVTNSLIQNSQIRGAARVTDCEIRNSRISGEVELINCRVTSATVRGRRKLEDEDIVGDIS